MMIWTNYPIEAIYSNLSTNGFMTKLLLLASIISIWIILKTSMTALDISLVTFLVEFAKRISAMVRKESVVIRQGGDEFVILTYRTDEADILAHSQAILERNRKPYYTSNSLVFVVGASIGIAKYPEHGTSLDMLLRAADIAMYEAKNTKTAFRLFAPSMQSGLPQPCQC